MICILALLFTIFVYVFDVYTDGIFSWGMFKNAMKNFSVDTTLCQGRLIPFVDYVTLFCKNDFNGEKCSSAIKRLERRGKCLEVGQQLTTAEWILGGWVSSSHIIASVLFVFLTGLFDIKSLWHRCVAQNGLFKRVGDFLHILC